MYVCTYICTIAILSVANFAHRIQSQTNNEPSKFRKYLTIKSDRARAFSRIVRIANLEPRKTKRNENIYLEIVARSRNCNCRFVFSARALPKTKQHSEATTNRAKII